jgi:hypothetical protein
MEVSGQLHVQSALPVGKAPHYIIDEILEGPQNESGDSEKEKSLLLLPEIEP